MRVMRVAHEAPGLSSSVNIGAFNLGNALGAAAGGAVISGGLGYSVCAGDGGDYRRALALLLVLVSRASAAGRGFRQPVMHRLGKGKKKPQTGRPRLRFLVYAGEVRRNKLPVDQRPEVVQVAWTGVAVVDVVGVFPNVHGQQRLRVGGQRGAGVSWWRR